MYRQPTESATPVARLRGMSDFSGGALGRRQRLRQRLVALFAGYGYRELDTPLLEPTELFLRKSGGELASQLFSFTDPGSRAVSLRPEFTAPVMRHYLEQAGVVELPARWQYCGPVFRFDGAALPFDTLGTPAPDFPVDIASTDAPGNRGGGQFTQIGGELLGASSPMADGELLSLATAALSESGIGGWTLRLADLGVLNGLLEPLGLSERARAFVVQNVPQLRDGPPAISRLMDDARRLRVIGRAADDDYLSQAVRGLNDDEARNVLLGVLRSNPLDQLGQRQPEEVVARLLRKIRRPDAEESLRRALESAGRLAQVQGEPPAAIARAYAVLREAGADRSSAERLERVIAMLPQTDGGDGASGRIVLDLGLVRGLAYYNGIIFEVSHPAWPGPLGGGGRYDGLARDLGGRQRLAALGFAYNLDALADLTSGDPGDCAAPPAGVLVAASGPAAQAAALDAARAIRAGGETAEAEVTGRTVNECMAYAARRGFSRVVVAREDGDVTVYDV